MSLKTFALLLSLVFASTAGALRQSARLPSSQIHNRAASQVASTLSSHAVNGASTAASSALASAASNAAPQATGDPDCGIPSAVMPFLRAYSPGLKDHYYTVDPVELVHHEAGGYADQGVAGLVFRDSTDSTVPLYRLYNADEGEHYYTTSVEEADQGYENEGAVAYVYETQICGGIPLYYVRNEQEADNLYTVFEAERDVAIQNLGYEDKGVACYVLP